MIWLSTVILTLIWPMILGRQYPEPVSECAQFTIGKCDPNPDELIGKILMLQTFSLMRKTEDSKKFIFCSFYKIDYFDFPKHLKLSHFEYILKAQFFIDLYNMKGSFEKPCKMFSKISTKLSSRTNILSIYVNVHNMNQVCFVG